MIKKRQYQKILHKCKICNKEYFVIQSHVQAHNLSVEEYLKLYPTETFLVETVRRKEYIKKFYDNKKENIDYVVCKICGEKSISIPGHVIRSHKIQQKDYLKMFPNAILFSENYKKRIEDYNLLKKEKYTFKGQVKKDKEESFEKRNENIDYVICKICSFKGVDIRNHIFRKHKMRIKIYQKKFPNVLVKCDNSCKLSRKVLDCMLKDDKFAIVHILTGISYVQYKGGYDVRWTKELREQIRKRDNYTCQLCGKHNDGKGKFDVHHIDYDKKNNVTDNLIYLCGRCHSQIEGCSTSFIFLFGWTFYLQELVKENEKKLIK